MTEPFPSDPVPVKVATSDLPKRAASAVIMLAVAIGALLAGGIVLDALIVVVAGACFYEFVRLVFKATYRPVRRLLAVIAGAIYIGGAGAKMIADDAELVALAVGIVIAVDTFAYFFGRSIGGPKIAPKISPSKTWAGLFGGIGGAATFVLAWTYLQGPVCQFFAGVVDRFEAPRPDGTFIFLDHRCHLPGPTSFLEMLWPAILIGVVFAVIAQAGDFLESWLKRRAGVKDSSQLIPGHGGVLDRVDGLIAVSAVSGLIGLVMWSLG